MSFQLQQVIHGFTQGSGARVFRLLFVLIVVIAIGSLYDSLAYRNFANREAMDMAQLGKNIAEGKGYTTLLIRPFSMALLAKHRPDRVSEIKEAHPDLANPPVYPYVLAGLFKLIPAKDFTTQPKGFSVYIPELAVTLLNQIFLLTAAVLLFFLAERLFDGTVAWITAIVFVGTEEFWRFSASGLNSSLLMVILVALAWCLVVLEQWTRRGRSDVLLVFLAIVAGVLVGVGGLTRYAFGWLIIPVVFYLAAFFESKRAVLALAAVAGFLVVMGPWVARNYSVSGQPFGTATFTACMGTPAFPDDALDRSLHPNLRAVSYGDLSRKLLQNGREILQDLPKLGGSWVTAFFIVGLLVPFRAVTTARLRWFLLFSLVVLGCAQALGRTPVTAETPEINSDNMLVLLAPLVFLFGVALFFVLIESIALPFPAARTLAMVSLCVIAGLPLAQQLLPPHAGPVAYPPYYPPLFQRIAGWYGEKEMIMSDMPWALAWYGRRQAVWLTLNWKKDFVEITDYHKPIKGIYITQLTTDTKFLSNWVEGQNQSWTGFMLESMLQGQVPTGFPLRRAPEGFFPRQLLLTDYDRWKLKPE